MQIQKNRISAKIWMLFFVLFVFTKSNVVLAQTESKDTILSAAVIYNGDTIEARTLDMVSVFGHLSQAQLNAMAQWTRLRNAVYVTYPYARRAGGILNDINAKLTNVTEKGLHKNEGKRTKKRIHRSA
jgi:hypothetical protein